MAKRRKFSPKEKLDVVRKHLLEHVPVSDLCDEHDLNPNVFYRWQKQLFEQGTAAFQRTADARERALEGINNKIKVIKLKAYGYHDHRYFTLKVKQAFDPEAKSLFGR